MPKKIENLSDRLTDEARRQVMEGGYDALNIRTVAKNCGVGVGTVYNYFSSKDELIAGFLLDDWLECLAKIKSAAEKADSIEPALREMYDQLGGFMQRYGALFLSSQKSITVTPIQYHHILRQQISDIFAPFCRDSFDSDFIAEAMLHWTVEGAPFERLCDTVKRIV